MMLLLFHALSAHGILRFSCSCLETSYVDTVKIPEKNYIR